MPGRRGNGILTEAGSAGFADVVGLALGLALEFGLGSGCGAGGATRSLSSSRPPSLALLKAGSAPVTFTLHV